MKKLMLGLLVGVGLMGVVMPLMMVDEVRAQDAIKEGDIDEKFTFDIQPLEEGKFGLPDVVGGAKNAGTAEVLIKSGLKKVFETGRILLGSVAVLFLIYGGIKLGSSQGEEGVKKAREIIQDAVVAMVLITAAPMMVDVFFQGGSGETGEIGGQQVEEFWKGAGEGSLSGGEEALYLQMIAIIDFIMLLLIPIFIGMIIYFGALNIFSIGDVEWLKKQRKGLLWGLGGLGLVLMSKSIVAVFFGKTLSGGAIETNEGIDMSLISVEIVGVINFLLSLAGIAALAMMIWTGYQMLMAGDNKDEFEKGKKQIGFIVIGIVIMLSSYLIVNTLVSNEVLIPVT